MKNIVKVVFSICLLFLVGLLTILFLFPKSNKVLKRQVKLNYDLTYEQAFPDKEFRRLILTMLKNYKPNAYDGTNINYYYDDFYGTLKYTGDSLDTGIGYNNSLDDNDLETFSREKIDKNLLDQVKIIHANKNVEAFKNIASLQGIEYFPNLQALIIAGTKIEEVDFSNNPELLTLFLPEDLYTASGHAIITGTSLLERVNIRNNSKLKNLVLNLNPNKENDIDLSGNHNLEGLFIEKSNLRTIDLTSKPALKSYQINLKENRLQEIRSDTSDPYFSFGATDQIIRITIDKGEPVQIPLRVNNTDFYLDDNSDFIRVHDTYTFNRIGQHRYSFFDKATSYAGTVEVNVVGGEAKNFKPILNTNYKCMVGTKCEYRDFIANWPEDQYSSSIYTSDKGIYKARIQMHFSDGSTGEYDMDVPFFETVNVRVDEFQVTSSKSEYIEGNLSKTLVLSYSEIGDSRDDYLNILKRKDKCNYENFTCPVTEYNVFGYYTIGPTPISDSDKIPGKFGEYSAVNNTPILDSQVKVYNSKQMEQVIRNYNNGADLIDWKGTEEEKKYYLYPTWNYDVQNMLETTILRDTDRDGIPDTLDEDDDNDGISDEQEKVDGTDSKDKSSYKVTKICYKIEG